MSRIASLQGCNYLQKCDILIKSKKRLAFTLAEVLITLAIIGVVAALTIPALINNTNDEEYKTAYKKAFSVLSQAWTMAATNGDITPCDNWGDWSGGTCHQDNFNALKKYLKITKDCGTDTASCWNMSGEKSWGGNYPTSDATAFIDASGFAWSKLQPTPSSEILVDTNGNKGPNKYGKDRAIFYLVYFAYGDKANVPYVTIFPDFPTSPTYYATNEQQNRCPSIITDSSYHCYYTSWITGAQ